MKQTQFEIEIVNRNSLPIDRALVESGVAMTLDSEGIARAAISVAIVGNSEMRRLNKLHLEHDYDTDVLSFSLGSDTSILSGELIISSEFATQKAIKLGWRADHELLLYTVHGTLHLCGYGDRTPEQRQEMRNRELFVLEKLGVTARYE